MGTEEQGRSTDLANLQFGRECTGEGGEGAGQLEDEDEDEARAEGGRDGA